MQWERANRGSKGGIDECSRVAIFCAGSSGCSCERLFVWADNAIGLTRRRHTVRGGCERRPGSDDRGGVRDQPGVVLRYIRRTRSAANGGKVSAAGQWKNRVR